jgi:endonuclease YncB( thermonuclease family)
MFQFQLRPQRRRRRRDRVGWGRRCDGAVSTLAPGSSSIRRRIVALSMLGFSVASASYGQTPPPSTPSAPPFAIPQNGVAFVSGDTWIQNGQQMRLYGVQACLRGTAFTNPAGVKTDCGEASLAYLAAVVRDTHPTCAPIAQIMQTQSIIVVCTVHVGAASLDLGTVLIAQGYAFAAFTAAAKPVYIPYLVAELLAKKQHSGLWAAPDMPYPTTILLGAIGATPQLPQ